MLAALISRSFGIVAGTSLLLLAAEAFPQDRFFDSAGVRIRYIDEGEGEPVVLIHGFTGRLEVWKEHGVLEALARDFRVIALDCRGHGKSDKPHDPEMYGAEMAEDVVRVLDYLNLKKAHVVGYSMGARLTGYLLAKKADRLITATFGGSPPRLSFSQEEERARRAIARIQERGLTADDSDGQDYVALAALRGSS